MKPNSFRKAIIGLAGCLALGAFAVDPTVSDVVVRQRWPWDQRVDIEYKLNCGDPNSEAYIRIDLYDGSGTAPLGIPLDSLSGDLYKVKEGFRRIVWDPFKTGYTNAPGMSLRATVTPTNPPLYVIVDLTQSAGATNQVSYIYPGDARLETYDKWTNVWFGVTNDTLYKTKTDKLVLRRVPAGAFKTGEYPPATPAVIQKDFYAGVFTVTEAQWYKVMAGTAANPAKPKLNVTYNDIRGSTNNIPPIDYPAITPFISPTNFLGVLRAKTGIGTFNLPTSVEWECLCRAGTTSYFNDGTSTSADDTNTLSEVGWWIGNSGGMMHEVGTKAANSWGIYDTLGSVYEWCMTLGPNGTRVVRGGSYISAAANNRVAYAANSFPDNTQSFYGFRLVMTLPK